MLGTLCICRGFRLVAPIILSVTLAHWEQNADDTPNTHKWVALNKVYIHVDTNRNKMKPEQKKKRKEKPVKPGLQPQSSWALTLTETQREAQSHATVTLTAKVLRTLTQNSGRFSHSRLALVEVDWPAVGGSLKPTRVS